MKWLETPHDEGEHLLREGLEQARRRTGDEIMHRRVWGKVNDALARPKLRFSGRLALASAALVLLFAGGLFGFPRLAAYVASPDTTVATAPEVPASPAPPATSARTAPAFAEPQSATAEQAALLETERVPGHVVRTRGGERARVALGGGAEAELAENSVITWDRQRRPSIEQGNARLSVPRQPPGWRFSLTAGPYVVTVVGTKFEVHVANRTVGIGVTEGVVEVWRGGRSTRLVAGDSWTGPLYPDEARAASFAPSVRPRLHAPPLAKPAASAKAAPSASRGPQNARAALQSGDTGKAVEILTRTAQGSGPAAENAAYELGRIARYHLNRPRQAVALWDKYRIRFPSGLLRTEADLSIVDTLSSLGDVRAALTEAQAFLLRHPSSERRADVQKLVERLRATESAAGQR
ncbi:MAG: FecR domain-containing protein [Deltaproteobacteria bacterium]|nr:FecR domain-containing protein [Deltaproteobacteria bacterium]